MSVVRVPKLQTQEPLHQLPLGGSVKTQILGAPGGLVP